MNGSYRDIIVIGGSIGALEALKALLRDLPEDLPAAVLIVVHLGRASALATILDRAGPLRVKRAENGELLKRGLIYVASPDRHMLLHDGRILLSGGPRENFARPAIDALFRSAAASYGSRVIGTILSGSLSDGTAGLRAVKRCAGLAVVQNPGEAACPDMPRNALNHVAVDHCVDLADMAPLLADLVRQRAPKTPPIPLDIRAESAIAAQGIVGHANRHRFGAVSPFSCPDCDGVLWAIADGRLMRYRCRAGHAFTAEAVLTAQAKEVGQLLENLLRTTEQRAALMRRSAARERRHHRVVLAAALDVRGDEYDESAALMRRLIRGSGKR